MTECSEANGNVFLQERWESAGSNDSERLIESIATDTLYWIRSTALHYLTDISNLNIQFYLLRAVDWLSYGTT